MHTASYRLVVGRTVTLLTFVVLAGASIAQAQAQAMPNVSGLRGVGSPNLDGFATTFWLGTAEIFVAPGLAIWADDDLSYWSGVAAFVSVDPVDERGTIALTNVLFPWSALAGGAAAITIYGLVASPPPRGLLRRVVLALLWA